VHVQSRIFIIYYGIGQVLQAISKSEMPEQVKIDVNMGYKLHGAAQILVSEFMLADDRGVYRHGDSYFSFMPVT
jgi:hypothetical protein